jgi:hypothetical protein
MRIAAAFLGLAALAACGPTAPEDTRGVGFGDYGAYQSQMPTNTPIAVNPRISDETRTPAPYDIGSPPAPATPADPGAEIAAATTAALGTGPAPEAAAPMQLPAAMAAAPAAPATGIDPAVPTGMSDEQDFKAVSSRESIESDRARIAANRAAYQEVQPAPLPSRAGASDTRVIDYALSTSNPVGQPLYKRSGSVNQQRFLRACAPYAGQDEAQEAFLKAGGPARDPKYLDPDGDGFACFWDPTPFRKARQGAVAAPIAREVLPGAAGTSSGG